jgi:hypothetical protein
MTMKLKVVPNRTIPEKKKSTKNKTVVDKIKSLNLDKDKSIREDIGTVPTKFQYDDDFDNWFPWETH